MKYKCYEVPRYVIFSSLLYIFPLMLPLLHLNLKYKYFNFRLQNLGQKVSEFIYCT